MCYGAACNLEALVPWPALPKAEPPKPPKPKPPKRSLSRSCGPPRFTGVAYRIRPTPDGKGEIWTPDAFGEEDLRAVREHIPTLRIVAPGYPTGLEMEDADLVLLAIMAEPPRPVGDRIPHSLRQSRLPP
jgi:hypothetical protein